MECRIQQFNLQKNYRSSQMSSFLDRFIGRTQTISKLGPEQLLKGREESLIYTNTHKSFARSSTHQLRPRQQPLKEEQKPIVVEQQEEPFHLPHLQQRYLNSEIKRQEDPHTHSRMRLDRQTNWLVEEPEPHIEPEPVNRLIASVDPHKQNHGRALRDKEQRRLKSHHLQKSVSRLGGLGPNIGGEQWMAKKEKHQKAKKYAGQLKKIHRQKLIGKECSQTGGSFLGNKVVINY